MFELLLTSLYVRQTDLPLHPPMYRNSPWLCCENSEWILKATDSEDFLLPAIKIKQREVNEFEDSEKAKQRRKNETH